MNSLERKVLHQIGEDPESPDVFTDSNIDQIRGSINDAIEEIAMVTGGIKRKYYIPLVKQNFYRINYQSGSFGWVLSAWLLGQKRRLYQTSFASLQRDNPRWLEVDASPVAYIPVSDDIICVYPRPSGDDILEIECVIIPERYSDDKDKINLRSDFEWASVHYAVSEFWASRGDAKTALESFRKYLSALNLTDIHHLAQERQFVLS